MNKSKNKLINLCCKKIKNLKSKKYKKYINGEELIVILNHKD